MKREEKDGVWPDFTATPGFKKALNTLSLQHDGDLARILSAVLCQPPAIQQLIWEMVYALLHTGRCKEIKELRKPLLEVKAVFKIKRMINADAM